MEFHTSYLVSAHCIFIIVVVFVAVIVVLVFIVPVRNIVVFLVIVVVVVVADKSTSETTKVIQNAQFLTLLNSKCVWRHNKGLFFRYRLASE